MEYCRNADDPYEWQHDEIAEFRFELNQDAMAIEKLSEGIRGFVADQNKLEVALAAKL